MRIIYYLIHLFHLLLYAAYYVIIIHVRLIYTIKLIMRRLICAIMRETIATPPPSHGDVNQKRQNNSNENYQIVPSFLNTKMFCRMGNNNVITFKKTTRVSNFAPRQW